MSFWSHDRRAEGFATVNTVLLAHNGGTWASIRPGSFQVVGASFRMRYAGGSLVEGPLTSIVAYGTEEE